MQAEQQTKTSGTSVSAAQSRLATPTVHSMSSTRSKNSQIKCGRTGEIIGTPYQYVYCINSYFAPISYQQLRQLLQNCDQVSTNTCPLRCWFSMDGRYDYAAFNSGDEAIYFRASPSHLTEKACATTRENETRINCGKSQIFCVC